MKRSPAPRRQVVAGPAARRADLAAIHIAKQQLGWDDDHYRDVMWAVCTARSSAELDHTGRARFLAHLQACMRAHKPAAAAPARTPAARPITGPLTGPQRLMWSLWQQLADSGLVKHRGMSSLMRYAERQTSVARLEWLNSAQEELVIESLKLWLKRGDDGS